MVYDKESIHDNEISPLVNQINEICKREDIPFFITFVIRDDGEDGPLMCSSARTGHDKSIPGRDVIGQLVRIVRGY